MKELRNRMLRRLFHDAHRLSRNRHFHTYLDPGVRHAALIARILRGLRFDLINRPLTDLTLERIDGRDGLPWVRLRLVWPHAVRVSVLTEQELQILREDPQVDALLRKVERRGSPRSPAP